jgi:[ribosomal protein S18]-alanine N-acetyltransferase
LIEVTQGSGLDVAAIMPVMDDAFDPRFGEAWTAAQCLSTLAMPGGQLLIARIDGVVVGFALSRGVIDEEELLLIGVLTSARRQGVGQRLLSKLNQICAQSGRETLFLEVRQGNKAQSFYSCLGFNPIGRRSGYYKSTDGSKHDSITMALDF